MSRGTASHTPLCPQRESLHQAKLREGEPAIVIGISPTLLKDLMTNLKETGADAANSEHSKTDWTSQKHRSNYPAKGAQTQPWPAELSPTGIPSPLGEVAKVPGSTQHTARVFTRRAVASSGTLQEPAPNTNKERAAVEGRLCPHHTVSRV